MPFVKASVELRPDDQLIVTAIEQKPRRIPFDSAFDWTTAPDEFVRLAFFKTQKTNEYNINKAGDWSLFIQDTLSSLLALPFENQLKNAIWEFAANHAATFEPSPTETENRSDNVPKDQANFSLHWLGPLLLFEFLMNQDETQTFYDLRIARASLTQKEMLAETFTVEIANMQYLRAQKEVMENFCTIFFGDVPLPDSVRPLHTMFERMLTRAFEGDNFAAYAAFACSPFTNDGPEFRTDFKDKQELVDSELITNLKSDEPAGLSNSAMRASFIFFLQKYARSGDVVFPAANDDSSTSSISQYSIQSDDLGSLPTLESTEASDEQTQMYKDLNVFIFSGDQMQTLTMDKFEGVVDEKFQKFQEFLKRLPEIESSQTATHEVQKSINLYAQSDGDDVSVSEEEGSQQRITEYLNTFQKEYGLCQGLVQKIKSISSHKEKRLHFDDISRIAKQSDDSDDSDNSDDSS